jgi:hypothetical protein
MNGSRLFQREGSRRERRKPAKPYRMAQTKITIVGKLRFSEGEGLAYSLEVGKPPNQKTLWLEAGPENAHDWPGLGKYPERPEEQPAPNWRNREAFQQWSAAKKTAEEDWKNAYKAYDQKLNADPAYRRAQFELMELQRREPQLVSEPFAVLSGQRSDRSRVFDSEANEGVPTVSDRGTSPMTMRPNSHHLTRSRNLALSERSVASRIAFTIGHQRTRSHPWAVENT